MTRSVTEGTAELVERALARDGEALRSLVDMLTPVIQSRVARALLRRASAASGRNIRQEVADLTQDVFAALFADQGRALRAWRPERGLTLANFVGFVAERQVASILRTTCRSPWTEDPTLLEELDSPAEDSSVELRLESQQMLEALLDRLREELSPLGLSLFEAIFIHQRSVPEVCEQMGMSRDAVYAWQSRLGRLSRRLGAELMSDSQDPPRIPKVSDVP
ncbi:RNA polymerase sigma factor [Pyxidicoccus xibeiensis]|uniref:RNA polymerase sigma factor n=1 Tax=Pyxidicoccus xibeiensis TaxID=2906759 RepID=UPI0020A80B6D|nr:sigma-70 family RNA polymerase sigma factor [Pyxidicoccus xibeiensis]MCP3137818.1 sigma-70 family RNA polymerase sigma factor [Pyxidicoccus xibeiensis]